MHVLVADVELVSSVGDVVDIVVVSTDIVPTTFGVTVAKSGPRRSGIDGGRGSSNDEGEKGGSTHVDRRQVLVVEQRS